MKLVCIKQDSYYAFTGDPAEPELIVGNEYSVIDITDIPDKGRYYKVAECNFRSWFHNSLFAELDTDLDETTLVNEEWEEKVCVPV